MKKYVFMLFAITVISSCSKDDPQCTYDGEYFPIGSIAPDNDCEVCMLYGGTTRWTTRTDVCCIDGIAYENGCCIDGQFYPERKVNPNNKCEACLPKQARNRWSRRDRPGKGCCIDSVFYPVGARHPEFECFECRGTVANLGGALSGLTSYGFWPAGGKPCSGGHCDGVGRCVD